MEIFGSKRVYLNFAGMFKVIRVFIMVRRIGAELLVRKYWKKRLGIIKDCIQVNSAEFY